MKNDDSHSISRSRSNITPLKLSKHVKPGKKGRKLTAKKILDLLGKSLVRMVERTKKNIIKHEMKGSKRVNVRLPERPY